MNTPETLVSTAARLFEQLQDLPPTERNEIIEQIRYDLNLHVDTE